MNTYTLTSEKMTGCVELQYDKGLLNVIKIDFKSELNSVQFDTLMRVIPQFESNLKLLAGIGLVVTQEPAANQKIALFCRFYEQHVGLKYKVTLKDSGKIKLVKMDEQILTVYFTCNNNLFKGKYSIHNLVNFYNELMAEVKNAGKPKSPHPDHWSQPYYNTLSPAKATEYFAYLRSLGFVAKKDTSHNIIEFYKPDQSKN